MRLAPSHGTTRPDRTGSARLAGLALAGVVALASIGLVLWFALASRPRHTPAARLAAEIAPTDAPDLRALALADSPGQAQLTRSGRTVVQWSDKADPTRKAGELEYDSLHPLESKRYLMDRPRARIYLRDGRTVTIHADRARVYWPTTQNTRPESATLEGDAVIRLFDRGVDPAADAPVLTVTSPTFAFDGTLGELSTSDRLVLTSATADYTGVGLRLIYNEARERIELLRIESGHELTIRQPGATPRPPPSEPTPSSTAAAAGPFSPHPTAVPARPAETATPVLTLYNALLVGDVVMTWGDRRMTGDRLHLWTRLVDNRLRPGALGRPLAASQATTSPATHKPDAIAGDASAQPANPQPSPSPQDTPPLRLTWSGPLEVTPIEQWPEELADNDVAGRLTGADGVRFWEDGGHRGQADGVEYHATTRDLRAWGSPITLSAHAGQQLHARHIALNLATGVGHVRGEGIIRGGIVGADADEEHKVGRIEWSEQADFVFDLAQPGGPAGQLRQAAFAGNVRLREDDRPDAASYWLDAHAVHAHFAPAQSGGPALIRRLTAMEGVRAGDGQGAHLEAREADLAFVPGPDGRSVVPTLASAKGDVRATRDGSTVAARTLDARLGQIEGRTRVERVIASGDVRFERDDGTVAEADHLAADVPTQTVELTGEPALVEHRGGSVESAVIRLDGLNRRAHTPGPGQFIQQSDQEGPPSLVIATWHGSMSLDDLAGTLECTGGTRVLSRSGSGKIDTATARTIRATFTPASTPADDQPQPERRLTHIRLEGTPHQRATAESRQLDPTAQRFGAVLRRMVFIESEVLDWDAQAGVFSAPGPGRLVASHRPPVAPADSPLAPAPMLGHGDTLIDWSGSMRYDGQTAQATLDHDVRLTHSPLTGDLINLECDTLHVLFEPHQPGRILALEPFMAGSELRRAIASGAVWLRSGTRELTAGTLDYDPSTGVAQALASPGSAVTFLDPDTAAPVRAPAMIWNTRTNRLDIVRPETIVIPR